MAAAFALGAEGVQMGTRMVAIVESPVHQNMKQAVVDAEETDTMMINQHNGRPVRVLRTAATAPFELSNEGNPMALLPLTLEMYENGDLDSGLPQLGQVAGRIEAIQTAADIIRETVAEFESTLGVLADSYLKA
jgi:enoyl-[acyl-carrier protein] reductase II